MKIKIFADGANLEDIKKLNNLGFIKGFTTNPTLMRQANIKNYKDFAKEVLKTVNNKPISFEVFADDLDLMYKQAVEINSWGKNIMIKIPIQNTKGIKCYDLVSSLTKEGIYCNVTAIFTVKQVEDLLDKCQSNSNMILSIFAGRIADTGIDPSLIISQIIALTKNYNKIETLWASPREPLNIIQANDIGCNIITLTPNLINKMKNFGKDLDLFSLETVKMFYDDAKKSNFDIEI